MMPRKQDIRHGPPTVFERPGVLGILHGRFVRVSVRFVGNAGGINHPGYKPNHRVGNDHGRQFATGENVVANRDFLGAKDVHHSLVDPLVVPADHGDARGGREFVGKRLVEATAARRQQEYSRRAQVGTEN